MPRLKNPQETPPFGWQFIQSQISKEPIKGHSLDSLSRAVLALRQGNPGLTAEHHLSTDFNTVMNEVNEQNASRCIAHGWSHFVMEQSTAQPPSFPQPQRLSRLAGVAATNLKRSIIGVATIRDWWLGDSLKPVDQALAEKRAQVCVKCPLNTQPNFLEQIAGDIANTLKGLVGAKQDMDLKTSVEYKLFSCSACGCWMPLKVWVGLPYIKKNLKEEEKSKLDPSCWISSES